MRLTIIVTANINGFHETHNFLTVFFVSFHQKRLAKGRANLKENKISEGNWRNLDRQI